MFHAACAASQRPGLRPTADRASAPSPTRSGHRLRHNRGAVAAAAGGGGGAGARSSGAARLLPEPAARSRRAETADPDGDGEAGDEQAPERAIL